VLALALDDTQIRAVTHYDVNRAGIERALDGLARILREAEGARP
jgi:hypothetical protein